VLTPSFLSVRNRRDFSMSGFLTKTCPCCGESLATDDTQIDGFADCPNGCDDNTDKSYRAMPMANAAIDAVELV